MAACRKKVAFQADYSRGTEPTTYRLQLRDVEVIVHRWHAITDRWFLSCRELNVDRHPLSNVEIDLAMEEAVRYLQTMAKAFHEQLAKVTK